MDTEINTYSILIVEDNSADIHLIEEMMHQIDSVNYDLNFASSLDDAKKTLFEQNGFDVILLDLGLPDSDGLNTLKEIKGKSGLIPIIVLTGESDEDLAHDCLKEGAHDYLLKSKIDTDSLRRTISYSILRTKESQISELEKLINYYQKLSTEATPTRTTAKLSEIGVLQDHYPDIFSELVDNYSELLNLYLDQAILKKEKPRNQMELLATQLGDSSAGPRDLLDIHASALNQLKTDIETQRAKALTFEGRLLALEMMGLLVDYYRLGNCRRFEK